MFIMPSKLPDTAKQVKTAGKCADEQIFSTKHCLELKISYMLTKTS